MQHIAGGDYQPVPTMGNATFEQQLDHNDPDAGTFSQWYMYDTSFWNCPGSPVVFFTPGEVNASAYTSYLSTNRTTGVLAQEIGAAIIVFEHRYWGYSSPVGNELTTENMVHLTLENAIYDMTNFARNAELPFDKSGRTNAKNAPWIMMGGSYSGALSAWTESVDPGTFWAYHSSSAPVQAISDYWAYFSPVQEGMPKNCSKDVNLVIEHIDDVLKTGSDEAVYDLKAMFGLETVEHNDDFAAALEWGPWLWQGNQFYTDTGFFDWCDFIENSVNETDSSKLPDTEGVGLDQALAGYAKWGKDEYFPTFCSETYGYFAEGSMECFDTYNKSSPLFTDVSLSNQVSRQWQWMLCNEPFGYWQTGAPEGQPTLVSSLVDAEYWIRQCDLFFPPGPNGVTYGLAKGKTEEQLNDYTGGWDIVDSTRLLYVNGDYDPWRTASVSSWELRPDGALNSTEKVPVVIVPGGFHVSDMVTQNGKANAGVQEAIDQVVAQLAAWVAEFPKRHGREWRG